MTYDFAPIALVVVGIAIIPAIIALSRFELWWKNRNKKRKVADFIQQQADQQIQAKIDADKRLNE